MKIEVNIEKKYFFGLLALSLMILGVVGVVAYNTAGTGGVPSTFGHSVDEIDWSQTISQLCLNGVCITNWTQVGGSSGGSTSSSSSGVSKIIAGNGITVSPTAGTGDVIVSAPWISSGSNVYYNSGNVGIGISIPTQKLDVNGNVTASGLCLGGVCKTSWGTKFVINSYSNSNDISQYPWTSCGRRVNNNLPSGTSNCFLVNVSVSGSNVNCVRACFDAAISFSEHYTNTWITANLWTNCGRKVNDNRLASGAICFIANGEYYSGLTQCDRTCVYTPYFSSNNYGASLVANEETWTTCANHANDNKPAIYTTCFLTAVEQSSSGLTCTRVCIA